MLSVVDQVFSIDTPAVERAKAIVLGKTHLSARDAVHLATMELQGIDRIMSFDKGFDGYPGIQRLHS